MLFVLKYTMKSQSKHAFKYYIFTYGYESISFEWRNVIDDTQYSIVQSNLSGTLIVRCTDNGNTNFSDYCVQWIRLINGTDGFSTQRDHYEEWAVMAFRHDVTKFSVLACLTPWLSERPTHLSIRTILLAGQRNTTFTGGFETKSTRIRRLSYEEN